MSEYMEKFTVSRLVGAPPGYVGYEEGGQLSERVRRKPYSVVLLDEIEKAHPDIFNILLQVLDEGRLTDSNGRVVNFRNTIVIMTSNVGSRELDEYGSGVGFATSGKNVPKNRQSVLEKAIKSSFPPEFINRVDERIFFNSLTKEDIEKIIDIELKDLRARAGEAGYRLVVTPAARRFIAEAGFDPAFGARPLKTRRDEICRRIRCRSSSSPTGFCRGGAEKACRGRGLLRVGLTADKENTLVSLKTEPLGVTVK